MTHAPQTLWTSDAAQAATGGRAHGAWQATGVSIDSRSVVAGDLFIAIKGPTFDGHLYVADALAKGAAAAVVTEIPEGLDAAAPLLLVDDALTALRGLARAARARSGAKVIAVTGSVGKTGTKEMLRRVLAAQGQTHATEGNLNNHWGLPLTLARMPEDTQFAVLEMGMNHPGELTPLSLLAQPDVAIVTAIEAVHSEHFDGIADIAEAKAEIFAGLVGGGVAIINRDTPYFDSLAAAAGDTRILGFGDSEQADVRLLSWEDASPGSAARIDLDGQALSYQLGVSGRHWAVNSLAVLAAVAVVGADPVAAANALQDMHAPKGRGAHHTVERDGGAFQLIDESYNASPVSMRAAFAVLAASKASRRVAVLGDMLELGEESLDLHVGLAAPIAEANIDVVYTCGANMHQLNDALEQTRRGGHAATSDTLAPLVTSAVRAGDVVMVKGSAGSRTGVIVDALLALGQKGGVENHAL